MTGPEFADRHGNDSSTWSAADIEAEINLAEIDAHFAPATGLLILLPERPPTPAA